jgi:chorismate mutase/prephenate dehydratase
MIDYADCQAAVFPQRAAVACQGVPGAYSEMAAHSLFEDPEIMYMRTFDGVFRAVESGLCRYGILPIENSNAGSVGEVYDRMREHDFFIVRAVKLSIFHKLLAKKPCGLSSIKEIVTHEQAARQCSRFLEAHDDIAVTISGNTATAARTVAESERADIAAIASHRCAELYDLSVLGTEIQNSDHNYTRFICISKDCEIYPGADRISLMLTLEHRPGSLFETMREFAQSNLNLTKLESRPIAETDFEFMFYFDVEGSLADTATARVLSRIEDDARQFTFLGNYCEVEATSLPSVISG